MATAECRQLYRRYGESGVTNRSQQATLLTYQAAALPRMGADTLRGCVKLGVPVCLGATSCVSRRVSERRTPSVPQGRLLCF
ncbi:hypothetical protein [Hafnia paralvei]|uniref:hypothetical protein n=1 Tax=Hafnia paralvei TaxID=546367 RepID=UPI003C4DFFFA